MIKILDFYTHAGHQYELAKLPSCEFYYIRSGKEEWAVSNRPKPKNVFFINPHQANNKDYHLLIVHNPFHHAITNYLKLPKIALIQSTFKDKGDIQSREYWNKNFCDSPIVFNSNQSKKDWDLVNCKRQHVIWAGLDPNEWGSWNGGLNRILVVCNEIMSRSICGFDIFVKAIKGLDCTVVGSNTELDTKVSTDFDNLRWYYNTYSVFFNTTTMSPMPRTRTEAMMSGMPIVTTNNQDASLFIKDGINGFLSNDPQVLHDRLALLLKNESLRQQLGAQARKTAIECFHLNRYLSQWKELIDGVLR